MLSKEDARKQMDRWISVGGSCREEKIEMIGRRFFRKVEFFYTPPCKLSEEFQSILANTIIYLAGEDNE